MDKELATNLETLHPDAFGWALHCCGGDVSRAEDVLQNAYLKVAQERVNFEGRATFKTWWLAAQFLFCKSGDQGWGGSVDFMLR